MRATSAAGLAELAGRHCPQVLAHEGGLALDPALTGLLGVSSLRRGSTLVVEGGGVGGATTLALALAAAASAAGAWTAAVGLPRLGLLAACELGCSPERLVVVPEPGDRYAVVVGALLDACDAVLAASPARLEPSAARRLATRARERRAVLIVLRGAPAQALDRGSPRRCAPAGGAWQDGVEARLEVSPPAGGQLPGGQLPGWSGLGEGCGHLRARLVEVVATRRRGAPPRVAGHLWLPGADGRIAAAEPVRAAPPSGLATTGALAGALGAGALAPAVAVAVP